MTLANLQNTVSHAGDDVTVAFAIPFPFEVNAHIDVYLVVDSTGVETLQTNYSLTGAGGLTGTCTMDVAPETGQTLFIRRVLPLTQETDYQDNDAFDADTSEVSLDRLAQQVQQIATDLARALRKSGQTGANFDAAGAGITDVADGVEPGDAATVGQISSLVAAAVAIVQTFPAASVSAFMVTLLDDVDSVTARATLGLGSLATISHISDSTKFLRADGNFSPALTDYFEVVKTTNSAGNQTAYIQASCSNAGAGRAIARVAAAESKTGKSVSFNVDSTSGNALVSSQQLQISVDGELTKPYLMTNDGMSLNSKQFGYREIGWVTKNTSFTLDLATDLTALPSQGLRKTDANPYNYTIPLNATDAFPEGYTLPIMNLGTAGAVSIVPTGGVTLRLAGSTSASATRVFAAGAFGGICKVGADDWVAYGSGVS